MVAAKSLPDSASRSHVACAETPPVLAILPLDAIYIHEPPDRARTEALKAALASDAFQAHPVIVAHIEGQATHWRVIHVDGANRLTAVRELGYDHICVQVINAADARQVSLASWSHVTSIDLRRTISDWGGKGFFQSVAAGNLTVVGEDLAYIHTFSGETFRVRSKTPDLRSRLDILHKLLQGYRDPAIRLSLPLRPHRRTVEEQLRQAGLGENAVVITFVPLSYADFLELPTDHLLAPAGVTRFVIRGGRVLGVNMPLRYLAKGASTVDAHRFLVDVQARPGLFHPGPVEVRDYLGWRTYDEDLILYDNAIETRTPAVAQRSA